MNINKAIEECDWVIDYYTKNYKYSSYYDDLKQVARIGVMEALKRYDKRTGTKFTTFAFLYVKGEVAKYLREIKTIPVSKDMLSKAKELEKAREFLSQVKLRPIDDYELAEFLEISVDEIWNIKSLTQNIMSLDNESDETKSIYETYGNEVMELNPDIMDLYQELEQLDYPENDIIVGKYFHGKSQSELSRDLGISQATISRIEGRTLKRMRTNLL